MDRDRDGHLSKDEVTRLIDAIYKMVVRQAVLWLLGNPLSYNHMHRETWLNCHLTHCKIESTTCS